MTELPDRWVLLLSLSSEVGCLVHDGRWRVTMMCDGRMKLLLVRSGNVQTKLRRTDHSLSVPQIEVGPNDVIVMSQESRIDPTAKKEVFRRRQIHDRASLARGDCFWLVETDVMNTFEILAVNFR